MAPRIPFRFHFRADVFHKADAPDGKQKRIGGIVSTETPDKQGEVVLQEGLDFGEFLSAGWFNDNHSKETTDVVGYPEQVRKFRRGATLPNGSRAQVNGTWVEGYLLDTKKGQDMCELGQALQKTNRRLGFSVEGKVERRAGPRTVFLKDPQSGQGQWVGREIVRATVRNVAVTNSPVQGDSKLEILAKSMMALERQGEDEDEKLGKTLAMGPATPGQKPVGPQTGRGAGKVLARQHLERKEHDLLKPSMKKSLTDVEAVRYVQSRISGISRENAGRIVRLTKLLKQQNRL